MKYRRNIPMLLAVMCIAVSCIACASEQPAVQDNPSGEMKENTIPSGSDTSEESQPEAMEAPDTAPPPASDPMTAEEMYAGYGYEIAAYADNRIYAKYDDTIYLNGEYIQEDAPILKLPSAIKEAFYANDFEKNDTEYYISAELIRKYYDENLQWDGSVCSFDRYHLHVTIADGRLTAENELFGKIIDRECDAFAADGVFYINIDSVGDILNITEGSGYVCVSTNPSMYYREETPGKVRIFEYTDAEPVASLTVEPFWLSDRGIYYYSADDMYYADYDGVYYPLEVTDEWAVAVPK